MNKIIVKIDGMMCGMCESHICDTIRKSIPNAKKVSASRRHGEATFIYEGDIDETTLKKIINDTGYIFISMNIEPYKKKGLFS